MMDRDRPLRCGDSAADALLRRCAPTLRSLTMLSAVAAAMVVALAEPGFAESVTPLYAREDPRAATPGVVDAKPASEPTNPTASPPATQTSRAAPSSSLSTQSLSTSSTSSSNGSLINTGFETSNNGDATRAQGWQDFGNTGYLRVRRAGYNRSTGIKITHTAPTDISGAVQRVVLNQTSANPVFIGALLKGENIVAAGDESAGAGLAAEFTVTYPDGSQGTKWCAILGSVGTFDWRWIGFNSTVCTGFPIVEVAIFARLGQASGTAYFDQMQLRPYDISSRSGAITIQFDDGLISTATVAKPILDSFRFVGSIAAVSGDVGRSPAFVTADDLRKLQRAGWDVLSHSITHPDMRTLSDADALRELKDSKSTLKQLGLRVHSLAWPYGAYEQRLVGLAQRYYDSTRGYFPGDNAYGTFPYDVRVHSTRDTTTIAEVQSWVDDAKRFKRWMILGLHDIGPFKPNDIYVNTPEQLVAMCNVIAASGLPVISYRNGLAQFAVRDDWFGF